jgi:hypothetical protein
MIMGRSWLIARITVRQYCSQIEFYHTLTIYSLSGPNVSPSLVSPNLSTTSCTSDPFPPEDLPLNLNADFLFEASDSTWDSRGLYLVFIFSTIS